jgi:hypothetical protein
MMMMTLKDARDSGKISEFIKEHSADPKGDEARFNATLTAMARKSKAVPATSNEAGSDD